MTCTFHSAISFRSSSSRNNSGGNMVWPNQKAAVVNTLDTFGKISGRYPTRSASPSSLRSEETRCVARDELQQGRLKRRKRFHDGGNVRGKNNNSQSGRDVERVGCKTGTGSGEHASATSLNSVRFLRARICRGLANRRLFAGRFEVWLGHD